MIFVYILSIIVHLVLSGMLASAILTNRVEGKSIGWKLWVCTPTCFLFGIYYIIALIGYTTSQ